MELARQIGPPPAGSIRVGFAECVTLPFLTPVVNLLPQLESGRQSCLELDRFSADRVVESQKLGVQEISSIAG